MRVRGADRVVHWKPQVRIPIVVNGVKICDYVADFLVSYANGTEELVEVKGFETPEWKLKKRLLDATYLAERPAIKFTIVK
jgi:hypothetical protein